MISLNLGEASAKLRSDFRLWLKSNPPPILQSDAELSRFVAGSREWQKRLAGERWIGVHWPEAYGGRGLSLVEEAIVQEMLAEANSPQLVGMFGLTMVGPVLIKHGTEEQKKNYLAKILAAEELWCQGFSEPEAGSDLAALKTVAAQDGDLSWRITGQKVWTSFGQYAERCFLLARTDSEVAKHKGLTYFLLPMSSPGITVRPLMQITGDREFNEVFFDNTPVSETVGQPGEGWAIAIATLMYERVVLTFQRHLQSETALFEIGQILGRQAQDPVKAERFGRLLAKNKAVRALALSHLYEYSRGASPGPEGSLDKLFWSETFQEICEFGLSVLGEDVLDGSLPAAAIAQHRYLYSRGRTIAAGTSEIQRNIIAERVLGLPK